MSAAVKIGSRFDPARVLYEHETTDERQASGLAMRDALESAVKSGADLSDAYLSDAYLRGANLIGADLSGANLIGADLRGADLSDADLSDAYLRGADLSGADLRGANLRDAYLRGAYLSGANLIGADLSDADLRGANLSGANGEKALLIGSRPCISIGPVGSRSDHASLWLTDSGPLVRAGCFWGSLEKFEQAVKDTHGDNDHGREYGAVIALFRAHAEIWTPAKESAA
jgi:hypothetical protein